MHFTVDIMLLFFYLSRNLICACNKKKTPKNLQNGNTVNVLNTPNNNKNIKT
jgi:hypothetical protein